jgi:hypothetical protein
MMTKVIEMSDDAEDDMADRIAIKRKLIAHMIMIDEQVGNHMQEPAILCAAVCGTIATLTNDPEGFLDKVHEIAKQYAATFPHQEEDDD